MLIVLHEFVNVDKIVINVLGSHLWVLGTYPRYIQATTSSSGLAAWVAYVISREGMMGNLMVLIFLPFLRSSCTSCVIFISFLPTWSVSLGANFHFLAFRLRSLTTGSVYLAPRRPFVSTHPKNCT